MKTILILLFCVTNVFADHWVYIMKVSKITDVKEVEQVRHRADEGDIVDIIDASKHTPSKKEKETFTIIKVSGLTKENIEFLKTKHEDCYRENFVIFKPLFENVTLNQIINLGEYTKSELIPKVSNKFSMPVLLP